MLELNATPGDPETHARPPVLERPLPSIPSHIVELDGFRAIAIYLVLNLHFGVYVRLAPPYNVITQAGWVGVPLFFVLSGMLLSLPFVAAGLEGRRAPSALRFYERRALRIFPLFYASLITFVLLGLLQHKPTSLGDVLAHVFFVHNFLRDFSQVNAPYWSLAVEVQFYLLMPLIGAVLYRLARAGRLRTAAGLLFGIAGVSLAWRGFVTWDQGLLARRGYYFLVYASTLANFDAFATGMLCALAYASGVKSGRPLLPRRVALVAVPGSLLVIYLLMRYDGQVSFKTGAVVTWFAPSLFYTLLHAAWGICVLATFSVPATAWARLLRAPSMVFISTISYSLYVWHPLFKTQTARYLRLPPGSLRSIAELVIGVTLTLAFSTMTYKLIERPFLRAKPRG